MPYVRFLLLWIALTLPAQADGLTPLIGKTLMVGWPGDEVADDSSQRLCQHLSRGEVGGVLFLRHNFKSVADVMALTAYFSRCGARFAPLLALDQEGGRVDRLGALPGEPKWPSAAAVSASGTAAQVYPAMARRVAELGFNLNFGPVVDLNIHPQSPVIGALDRAYSDTVQGVNAMAQAFVQAHHSVGVRTAYKHFPGHGSATTDSHEGFTDISATWRADEWRPYMDVPQGTAIMAGHLVHHGLDPSGLPASLSKAMLAQLREGFDGIIVSDDMEMRAITDIYGFDTSVQVGLSAGLDVFIYSNSGPYDPARVAAYHAAVRDGLAKGLLDVADLRAKAQRLKAWQVN